MNLSRKLDAVMLCSIVSIIAIGFDYFFVSHRYGSICQWMISFVCAVNSILICLSGRKGIGESAAGRLYTLDDARDVRNLLNRHYIFVEIIGGIAKKGVSHHDMDFLILNIDRVHARELLSDIFKDTPEDTDWGGLYFKNTEYGELDFFFSTEDFDY